MTKRDAETGSTEASAQARARQAQLEQAQQIARETLREDHRAFELSLRESRS